jgi:2-aminoadipate transaminase
MNKPILVQTTQINLDPDVIDLGVGQPQLALLPLDLIQKAATERLAQGDASFLQYGAEQGDGFFRLALADFLTRGYGLTVEADDLFITNGASQGLDLVATLLAGRGDTVFVEEPSYFLALRILADHRLKLVGIPTDAHGLVVDALEEELKRQRPAFLYTIPTYQNPTTTTQTRARRERLAELSRAYDFAVVADEVYHFLNFGAPPPPPLAAYVGRGNIVSLGSFSKILAPGLRLGWIQTAPPMIERLTTSGLLDSSGGLNPFTSALVRAVLEKGWQAEHLAQLKNTYRTRATAMSAALHRELGEIAQWEEPEGGFFFWLRLPETMDALRLLSVAERHKVGYRPGVKFSSQQGWQNYLRLCFAFYDTPALVEGVARLKRVLTA